MKPYRAVVKDDKFVRCYDNDCYWENENTNEYYMEHVIAQIEKRTGMS